MGRGQVQAQVIEQLVDPGIPGGGGYRLLDELGLATLPVGRHHQPPGQLVGNLAAVMLANQIEAAVQAGGGASRGDEPVVVDVEGIGIEPHPGEALDELLFKFPMGGGTAPVQQAGVGQHIGAETEPHDLGSPDPGGNQGIEQGLGGALGRIAPEGDDDDIRLQQTLQAIVGLHAKALGGGGLPRVIPGAESQLEQRLARHHLVAKDEAGHRAVKGAEAIEGDDGDDKGTGHGGRLLCTRIPIIRGSNRKPKSHVVPGLSLRAPWCRHPRAPLPGRPAPGCPGSRAAPAGTAGHD